MSENDGIPYIPLPPLKKILKHMSGKGKIDYPTMVSEGQLTMLTPL